MTAIDFFQGLFCFPISADMVKAAVLMGGSEINDNTLLSSLDDDVRELSKAHLYRMVAQTQNGFTERSSSSDFGATNSVNNISSSQIRAMLSEANRIFRKYKQTEYVTVRNAINVFDDEK